MLDFINIIKKKLWLFLLFLLPSTVVVNFTNNLIYLLIMNSESLYKVVSYCSVVIITLFLVMAYSFIELKITNDYIKKIFKIIVIIIAVFFILTTLIKLILISSLFKYESCGREFNELYIEYAKSNDPSFCLDSKRNLNTFIGFKGDDYCKTPYKDTIIPTQDDFAATCITSFAKYTNDISHCDLIESNNLSISHSLSDSGFSGNKYHCIMAYAIDKLKPDYCDTLPKEGDYSDRNKCLKMVSRKSGDIS